MPLNVDVLNAGRIFIKGKEVISEPIDITYTQLRNKIESSELTPGQWYRLLDYKSVNFVYGFDSAYWYAVDQFTPYFTDFQNKYGFEFDGFETHEGDNEILLIQAKTENELTPVGYSEKYPTDVVEYNPNVKYLGIEFGLSNGQTRLVPTPFTVSGFDPQWDGTNIYFDLPNGLKLEKDSFVGFNFSLIDDSLGWQYIYGEYIVKYDEVLESNYTPNINYDEITSSIKITNDGTRIIILHIPNILSLYQTDSLNSNFQYKVKEMPGLLKRRVDTLKNVDTPFDFRGQRFRRFETERPFLGQVKQVDFSLATNLPLAGYANQTLVFTQNTTNGIGQNLSVEISFDGSGNVSNNRVVNHGYDYKLDDEVTTNDLGSGSLVLKIYDVTTLYYFSQYDKYVCDAGRGNKTSVFTDFSDYNGDNLTGNYKDVEVFQNYEKSLYPFQKIEWGNPETVFNYSIYSFDWDNNTFGRFGIRESKFYRLSSNTFFFVGGANLYNVNYNLFGYDASSYELNNSIKDYYNNISNGINSCQIQGVSNNIFNDFGGVVGSQINSNNIITMYNVELGDYFTSNVINYLFDNKIGDNFYNNILGHNFRNNTIGNEFNDNEIGENFIKNQIGDTFRTNTIGNYFYQNQIYDVFQFNTISNNFRFNTIKTFVSNTDFTSVPATYVYGNYNCDIFKRSNGTTQLSYVDGSNVVQYDDIDQ